MKKASYTLYTRIFVVFVIFLISVCVLQGIIYSIQPNTKLIDYSVDMSKGWKDEKGKHVDLSAFLNNKNIKYGKKNTIYYKIGKNIKPGYSMCFRSLSTDFTAYIGSKKIAESIYYDSPFFNNSTGSQWHFYTFKDDDIGKTIKVEMNFFYNDSASYFENMKACYQQDYIINAVTVKLSELTLAIFILSVGIFITIIGMYTKMQLNVNRDVLVTLGIFACNLSLWIIFETHLIELFFNASSIVHIVCCNTLLLLPISCVQFLAHLFDKKHLKFFNYSCLLSSIIYIACWVLNIIGIQDFHDTLYLCFASIVGAGITAVIVGLLESKHIFKKSDNNINASIPTNEGKTTYTKVAALIGFLACLIVDFLAYYFVPQKVSGLFSRTASLYAIGMCLIIAVKNIVNLSEEFVHATAMTKVAYNDILTGLGNRTAYSEKLEVLNANLNTYTCIGFVMFDVNNLKYVNDNLGHNYGDELIMSASQVIQNSFTESTAVYRIGGDEFVSIIISPNAKQIYKQSSLQFRTNVHNFNNFYNKPYHLAIAEGAAFYTSDCKQTLQQIIEHADHVMYDNKLAYKKTHPIK